MYSRMVKKILFSILVFLAANAKAQLLKPLSQGLPLYQGFTDEVIATSTDDNFIFIATRHSNGFGKGQSVTINKWNGFYWQQLPAITFSDSSNVVRNIAVYKGQVYIAGNFTVKSPTINSTKTLVRFNTILNKWEAVISNLGGGALAFLGGNGVINSLVVYKNQLIIAGYFLAVVNNDTAQNIVAYNGFNFTKCGLGGLVNTGTNGVINSMAVINDSLYIGGYFTKAGGFNAPNLAVVYDSVLAWKAAYFTNNSNGVYKVTSFQGNIAILGGDERIYYRTASGFQNLTAGLNYTQINDIQEYNNELWASGTFFVGGVATTAVRYASNWSSAYLPNANILELFRFKGGLFLISTNDFMGNMRFNRVAQIVFSQMRLSGRVFQDLNHNCKFDINLDRPFAKKMIHISGNENRDVLTDSNGFYSVIVGANSSINTTVTLEKFKNWGIDNTCSSSAFSIPALVNSIHDSLDFCMKELSNGADITVSIAPNGGFSSRREINEGYTLTYTNNGTKDINTLAGVELVLSRKLSGFNSEPAPSAINGNKITWSFSSLKIGEQRNITFSVKAKSDSFNLLERLNFIASSSFLSDLDNSDNADTLIQQITQNTATAVMKDLYPMPGVNDSFSLVTAEKNQINYIIHFENTSTTDTIHNVIVIDTIDVNSSIQYIQETGASHPYTTQIYSCPSALGKGVIVWTFTNINLPPFENNDAVASRGHIGFSVKFNTNLTVGTIIKNKAHVVFDYYDPIRTNDTYAKVTDISGIKLLKPTLYLASICSNPAKNEIVILRNFEPNATFELINSAGLCVLKGEVNSNTLDIKTLASGIYFLIIKEKGNFTSQKVIIQ